MRQDVRADHPQHHGKPQPHTGVTDGILHGRTHVHDAKYDRPKGNIVGPGLKCPRMNEQSEWRCREADENSRDDTPHGA